MDFLQVELLPWIPFPHKTPISQPLPSKMPFSSIHLQLNTITFEKSQFLKSQLGQLYYFWKRNLWIIYKLNNRNFSPDFQKIFNSCKIVSSSQRNSWVPSKPSTIFPVSSKLTTPNSLWSLFMNILDSLRTLPTSSVNLSKTTHPSSYLISSATFKFKILMRMTNSPVFSNLVSAMFTWSLRSVFLMLKRKTRSSFWWGLVLELHWGWSY